MLSEAFDLYLKNKNFSENTILSYKRDLKYFFEFIKKTGIQSPEKVNKTNVMFYIMSMEKEGKKSSTISRKMSAINLFYKFLVKQGVISENPCEDVSIPKSEKNDIRIMSFDEVVAFLEEPEINTPKGIRDKAMFELIYATGIRVSELIALKLSDVELNLKFISCKNNKSSRIIPFGEKAKEALKNYIKNVRCEFIKDTTDFLFLNYTGKPMSRQGFWKLVKSYSNKIGFDFEITPDILRHSFANHMLENGAKLQTVQEILGHSDIKTTQIYANLKKGKLREEYNMTHPRG